jgi:mono/diheme cytochrome c family protein
MKRFAHGLFRQYRASIAATLFALVCADRTNAQDAVQRGLELSDKWCNSCHITRKNDTSWDSAEFGPRFDGMGTLSLETLRGLFASPHAGMPEPGKLSDSDVTALSAYIASAKSNRP